MKIKTPTQLAEAEEQLQQLVQALDESPPEDEGDRVIWEMNQASKQCLVAGIEEFNTLMQGKSSLDVIPAWQAETGAMQVHHALFSLRSVADLDQEGMAKQLDTSQSTIARLENPCTKSYQVRSLERWSSTCGYEFLPIFVRRARYDNVASIARMGIEAAAIKYLIGFVSEDSAARAMRIFLNRIGRLMEADSVSCFVNESTSNRRCALFHHAGWYTTERFSGDSRSTAVVESILARIPLFADRAMLGEWGDFPLADQEQLRSVFAIPFNSKVDEGVILAGFRRDVTPPHPEYIRALEDLSRMIAFLNVRLASSKKKNGSAVCEEVHSAPKTKASDFSLWSHVRARFVIDGLRLLSSFVRRGVRFLTVRKEQTACYATP